MTLEGRETADPQWWKVGSHKSVGYFGWGQCSMMLSLIFIELGFNQPLPIWSLSFADGKLWTLVTWPVFYEGYSEGMSISGPAPPMKEALSEQ